MQRSWDIAIQQYFPVYGEPAKDEEEEETTPSPPL